MELVNRYLYAVRSWLPAGQRDDVIEEISDDLRSRISDRETELGRELSEAELAGILKQRGKPELVASQFYQSLISSSLLPAYWFVLKLVVLWVLVPVFALKFAWAANPGPVLIPTVWNLLMAAVFATGVITIVFAVLTRYEDKRTDGWDPRKLPRVPPASLAADSLRTPRYLAITELGISLMFILGWLYLLWHQPKFDFGDAWVIPAPVLSDLRVPILLLFLSGIPIAWASLAWPMRRRLRSGLRLAVNIYTVILIGVLLKAGSWTLVTLPEPAAKVLHEPTNRTNYGIRIGLVALGIVVLADSVQEIARLRKKRVTPFTNQSS